VTTTGGPEHSVAEPVTQEHFDGDDIVVVPDAAPHRRRRFRALVIGAVVVVLAASVGIAIAATRDDGNTSVRTVTPRRPTPAPASPPPRTPPKRPVVHKPRASVAPHTPVSSPPAVAVAPPPPPPAVAPTEPPATAPPSYPPSVLQWNATPAALTIKSGGHALLTVHVTNPTDGTVTLPHPLSCAPTLRGPKGHVIGSGVCAEMAQLMAPHDRLTQRYTIYATDTAAAGGDALAPGYYTLSVENLFDVKVTVKTGGP
jgi:hypothetical protein